MASRANACRNCGTTNSRLNAVCNRCGVPLPWAERLENAARQVRDQSDQVGIGIAAIAAPSAIWLIGGQFNAALQARFFPLISALAFCWYAPVFFNVLAFQRGWLGLVCDTPPRLAAARLTLLALLSGAAFAYWRWYASLPAANG